MNATEIIYTGIGLSHIPVSPNTNLAVILGLVDTAIGNGSSTAPDYSGYSLVCVKQTDGTSHPTNTQNFAEGISLMFCTLKTAYTTFTGTTYVTDQGIVTSAINALQIPDLTYSTFSITDTDTVTQVWNKAFTGFTGIINSIKPDSANWATIGAGATTSIISAFNTIIAYEATQDTNISAKQASLGTFNLTGIGGSTGQTPTTAISSLVTYAAALPTYDSGSITWGCVSQGGALQSDFDNVVIKINSTVANYIADVGTGLAKTSIGSCLGYRVAVDPTWVGLYKVAVDSSDATAGTGNYLSDKIISSDSTVTITNVDAQLDLSIPGIGNLGKVLVSNGGTLDYLSNKIPTTGGDWGMSIQSTIVSDQLILTPKITNPTLFIQNLVTTISQDSDLLSQFCSLLNSCATCNCKGAIGFSVNVISI